jgi:hypothetical protein
MDVTALTDRDRQEIARTRLLLGLQRILFDLALCDEALSLPEALKQKLRVEIEGCRMSDQELADKLGDKTGKPNDDFFPSLCMRGAGGKSQIITFQRAPRGNAFAIDGKTDKKTWEDIRQWMNAIVGRCRCIWDSWSEENGCEVRSIEFSSDEAALFFAPGSVQGAGFTVQPFDA